MKNLKLGKKILFSVLFIICLFLLKNSNSVNATTKTEYRWPIGGENANETYLDYEFYGQAGKNPVKDGKSGREYKVNNDLWPNEQQYYSPCESHFGMDITGINGHTYQVVSVADGTVIETSATYAQNPGNFYPDQNQRQTAKGLYDGGGYGNYIMIKDNSSDRCFLYAHLKGGSIKVSRGEHVSVGQEIATMGSSGDSGHMHLHFEIRKDLKSIIAYWNERTGIHRLQPTTSYTNYDPKDFIGSSPKLITEINLTNPNKTQYIQGLEELDLTGAKLTVKYNSGIVEDIDLPNDSVTITGFDNSKIGTQNINVAYEGENLNFNVEVVNTPAKRESVKFMRFMQFRQINIYYDKPVIVETAPVVTVKVGNEVKNARFIGTSLNNKKLVYRINYDEFDIFTSGTIYISATGKVKDYNTNTDVDCIFNNITIGNISEYKIQNTFVDFLKQNSGDATGDGIVDGRDASYVLSLYSKTCSGKELTDEEKESMKRSDVTGDGIVDGRDASYILSYYTNLSVGGTKEIYAMANKCDFNYDKEVNKDDYDLLKLKVENGNYDEKYDLNEDGLLNNNDLEIFRDFIFENGKRTI